MANSKLLKEAIADAKAVKETALANAKLALEEAFTPRLQSMLTQKLRAEAEMEGDEEQVDEELSSDGIGSKTDVGYPETPGATPNLTAQTDLSVGVAKDGGKPEQSGTDYEKVADINEEDEFGMESEPSEKDAEIAELKARLAELEGEAGSEEENPFAQAEDEMGMDDMGMDSEMGGDSMDMGADEESEDDMDLEAIIRELEAQLGDDEEGSEEAPAEENPFAANENLADGSEAGTDKGEDPKVVVTNEAEGESDEVDLEEILREMEADMKGDEEKMDEAEESEKEAELEEAYTTIKSLQRTINEVNLLNAKLLFANKLFRAHNMTNEQKIKVIETLDRTKSVREVKLVFSTLAENFKYTSINKNAKKTIKEGIASKVVKSTKPAVARTVISESTQISDRFKKLAGIIK
jgi:galactitol-specific phosphotransferase system IIB component